MHDRYEYISRKNNITEFLKIGSIDSLTNEHPHSWHIRRSAKHGTNHAMIAARLQIPVKHTNHAMIALGDYPTPPPHLVGGGAVDDDADGVDVVLQAVVAVVGGCIGTGTVGGAGRPRAGPNPSCGGGWG